MLLLKYFIITKNMNITAVRDKYLWKITIEQDDTKLQLTFDDVDPYELVQVAQYIIYQKDTKDWKEAKEIIYNMM